MGCKCLKKLLQSNNNIDKAKESNEPNSSEFSLKSIYDNYNDKNNFNHNINTKEDEIIRLKAEYRTLKNENNNLKNERNTLKNKNNNLNEQIEKLNEKLSEKKNIINKNNQEIEKLKNSISKFEKNTKNLEKKEKENKNNFDKIIKDNKAHYEKIISKQREEFEKYKKDKKFQNQNDDIFKYESEKNKLKKELEELKQKYSLLIMNKEPILVGLDNIGATCYMNATLQCLSNTTKLTEYFLKIFKYESNNKNKIMSNEYYNVVKNLWDRDNNNKSFSPNSFKEKLSQENPLFQGIQANDSKDLINFLLERFHLELNEPKKGENNIMMNNNEINQNDQLDENKMLNIFFHEFKMKYNSIISNLFYGMFETRSQCQKCKNIKYNFQVYSFLEFPLEQVNKYCFIQGKRQNYDLNNKNPDIELYECFEYNCNLDLMTGENQMYCNICNSTEDALYGTQIYSAPNYLIINLNRGRGAVYECKVNFPEKLNLLNFTTYKNGNTFFELYAVICHLGPSSMSGHFVAYCKKKKDEHYKWYLFNDAIISECKNQEEYRNGMPYILFYKAV